MMYDKKLYNVSKSDCNANIKSKAILFRLASHIHSDKTQILSGNGTTKCRTIGRFHGPQQRATYCSNNILVCISEILYHIYRGLLNHIEIKAKYPILRNLVRTERALCVFNVKEINDLVYIDASDFRVEHDPKIIGAITVFPDQTYTPFAQFANKVRLNKNGVIYPSARHYKDWCLVLFNDETDKINNIFERTNVRLSLLSEEHDLNKPPHFCDPTKQKINSTKGFYEFTDLTKFEELKSQSLIYPADLPSQGIVDFVRIKYIQYPNDAILLV
jgi:RES domain-containing protein